MGIKRVLILLLILITVILTVGCTDPQSVIISENFKKEREKEEIFRKNLLEAGLMKKLDETVDIGDDKIIIHEIIFDDKSFNIDYELPKQLSSLNIRISGETEEVKKNNNITSFQGDNTPHIFDTHPAGYIRSIPHDLKLINQKVYLEIEINNKVKKISIDFPGEKIAALTKEIFFNKEGKVVKDAKSAIAKVTLGVNYFGIEYKGFFKEFVALDLKQRRILKRTSGCNGGEDAIEDFEKISIHRENIDVKLLYEDRVILIDY